jgi:Transposase DDE domain group 1
VPWHSTPSVGPESHASWLSLRGLDHSVFDCEAGYRHTAFITDQDDADVATLELRHRRRARVEDAIRTGKETGMAKMPFAAFAHNQAWLEVSLLAQALLRWAALLCLDGKLALAEPKRVRQCLLHVAGRLVRSGRRVALRLPRSWPWAEALVAAFARLRALPAASP